MTRKSVKSDVCSHRTTPKIGGLLISQGFVKIFLPGFIVSRQNLLANIFIAVQDHLDQSATGSRALMLRVNENVLQVRITAADFARTVTHYLLSDNETDNVALPGSWGTAC